MGRRHDHQFIERPSRLGIVELLRGKRRGNTTERLTIKLN
jgi:hypothetical protein